MAVAADAAGDEEIFLRSEDLSESAVAFRTEGSEAVEAS